jgi:hypothetical protein
MFLFSDEKFDSILFVLADHILVVKFLVWSKNYKCLVIILNPDMFSYRNFTMFLKKYLAPLWQIATLPNQKKNSRFSKMLN